MMKRHFGLAAVGLALALGTGMVAAPRPAMAAEQASQTVAGVVTTIDLERNRLTLRSSDGTIYEFEASVETLKDLKVGDRIEAKRRLPPTQQKEN